MREILVFILVGSVVLACLVVSSSTGGPRDAFATRKNRQASQYAGELIMAQTLSPAPSSGSAASRAYDFYSKFGVNGNLDSGGSVANELADMAYIGIKNIRSVAFGASASDANNSFSALALLAAHGVRQHIFLQAATGGAPFNSMADWVNALKTQIVQPYGAQMITGVSGPNEANIQYFGYNGMTGVPAANAAQADLYALVKADPALSGIPVDMWPVAHLYNRATPGTVGDQTAHCDRANLHDYYAADNTHHPTGDRKSIQIALQSYLRNARLVCNRTNFVTTETGWYTPWQSGDNELGTNEYQQARLILNNLFDHASLPYCKGVYIFTLRWGSVPPDPSNPGWGIMNGDGSAKIAGTALHNLMVILTDPGVNAKTFAPGALTYSLSGIPAASGDFLSQKSNGAFQLILWNETPICDMPTGSQIVIPHSTVLVSLPPGSSGSIYDPIKGSAPVSNFSNASQLEVSLDDSPLIIEVR
jgi:hypothetical protein